MRRGDLPGPTLPLDDGPQRPRVHVTEGHRSVVSLEHDRTLGRFRNLHGRARGSVDLHVVLHRKSVEHHADELRVLSLLARGVEAGRAEPYVIRLPFARPAAGVAAGRAAAHAVIVDPAMVNAASIG